jgi:hypothetical protein
MEVMGQRTVFSARHDAFLICATLALRARGASGKDAPTSATSLRRISSPACSHKLRSLPTYTQPTVSPRALTIRSICTIYGVWATSGSMSPSARNEFPQRSPLSPLGSVGVDRNERSAKTLNKNRPLGFAFDRKCVCRSESSAKGLDG